MNKKITMEKLAAMAGCSHSTVSRALSGSSRISAETKKRILELAGRENYRAQKGQRVAATIWNVADFVPDLYIQLLLQHLAMEMHKRHFRNISVPFYDISLLNEFYITGAVSIIPFHRIARSWSASRPTPLVTVNDYSETVGGIHSVTSDEYGTVSSVVDMLLASGCRRPVFISPQADNYCHNLRNQSYLDAMHRHGIKPRVATYSRGLTEDDIAYPEADSFILAGENIVSLKHGILRRFPSAKLAVWYFKEEKHDGEIAVVQNFAELASQAVSLLECSINTPADAENRKIPCLIRNFL